LRFLKIFFETNPTIYKNILYATIYQMNIFCLHLTSLLKMGIYEYCEFIMIFSHINLNR